jgi:peptidoglycan/xylan/chitin deacetylase (PgdA/CDA1 family)
VAVTLDDGYADNLFNAKPLLERHEVPATVFVTAGRLGSQCEFWWDELDRLLLQPGVLPPALRLTVGGQVRQWALEDGAVHDDAAFERQRGWHIERSDDPSPRQALYRSLYHLLHAAPAEERQAVLDQLRRWASAPLVGRRTHRMLTMDELARLSSGGLIEIGAHTMSHPVLAALPSSAQRIEIQHSKATLEESLGQPVVSFAYPHGSGTRETVAMVQEAGFRCACASRPDVVWADADRFQLPRVVIRDWDGDTFGRFLRSWLDG